MSASPLPESPSPESPSVRPDPLVGLVQAALAERERPVPDLRVLHDTGDHVILGSAASGLVARVHAPEDGVEDVDVAVNRVRRLCAQGARLLTPLEQDAFALPDGRAVSLWPYATPAVATTAQFAALVRSLHDTVDADLPTWDLLPEVVWRCSTAAGTDTADTKVLATLRDWLRELQETRPTVGHPAPIHSDAQSANIMSVAGDLVLIDVDSIALGPREFDLGTRVSDNAREPRPQADIDELARFYGPSLVDADVLRWCADLREINVISWLITDGRGTPGAAGDRDRWLASFRADSGWWRHASA
jgi:hypothetical protein